MKENAKNLVKVFALLALAMLFVAGEVAADDSNAAGVNATATANAFVNAHRAAAHPLAAALVLQRQLKVVAHASGAGITADGSDYHTLAVHAREVKVIPYAKVQEIKASNQSMCTGANCVDQFGELKVLGVMRFGTQTYYFAGPYTEGSLSATVYSGTYSWACLRGDPACTAVQVGSLNVRVLQDYEHVPHLVVGTLSFTGGTYAGKTYNILASGFRYPAAIALPASARG